MWITFIWVGKTKNKHWAALEQNYLDRIEHFVPSQIHIVRESKGALHPAMVDKALERIGEAILKAVRPQAFVVLLDERGAQLASRDLASLIAQKQNEGSPGITFIVGGATGVAPTVGKRADFKLSLSSMTFPHEMARTVLLEQVYRAFAIIHNLPYPK